MAEEICTYTWPTEERKALLPPLRTVLSTRPEIEFAYAHGSFTRNEPFRDLDIAIYGADPLEGPLFPYEDSVAETLRNHLDLPFPIDVRIVNHAPIPFQYHAYTGWLILERDARRRSAILSYVACRYADLKPFLDHYTREAFADEDRRRPHPNQAD